MLEKCFKADKLEVKVFDTRENMGFSAAEDAASYIRELLSRKKDIYMIFAAAPSQNEFLECLSDAQGIEWSRVHALHMDEYVGLPEDAPQGFGNFLRRSIFDKVPFGSVHYIGTSSDSEMSCSKYDELLSRTHVDIVCMGIGENGHIAFNDPHVADFNDPLRIKKVDLDHTCRQQQVNDGCFATINDVPEYALTLTVPVLMNAERIFCVVPCATKAKAVKAAVTGPVSETCPSSILRTHPNATLYTDYDSARYIL